MFWVIYGIGVAVTIFGTIITFIAYNFDESSTTSVSKPTFAKLCYELTGFCEFCLKLGLCILALSLAFQ